MVIDNPELAVNTSALTVLARKRESFKISNLHFIQRLFLGIMLKIVMNWVESFRDTIVLEVWAGKPNAFQKLKSLLFQKVLQCVIPVKLILRQLQAQKLLKLILTNILKLPMANIDEIIRGPVVEQDENLRKYSSHVLFVAVEMGNTAFVVELLGRYPDLIRDVNNDNQSIFHVAVSHRHVGIYMLLHEIGLKNSIITLEDKNGNNILHLVGIMGKQAMHNLREDMPGKVLQIQQELLWFQEVEAILPPCFRERKNGDGLRPHELFTENHKDLLSKGEEWLKGTCAQLMVVGALVATITFAAAITFPGGYNQDTGSPTFLKTGSFRGFLVSCSISFLLASTSVLVVLSILTSSFREKDYIKSLPKKTLLAVLTLFYSVNAMLLAFMFAINLLYKNHSTLVPCIIIFSVLIPLSFLCVHLLPFVMCMFQPLSSASIFHLQKPFTSRKKLFIDGLATNSIFATTFLATENSICDEKER